MSQIAEIMTELEPYAGRIALLESVLAARPAGADADMFAGARKIATEGRGFLNRAIATGIVTVETGRLWYDYQKAHEVVANYDSVVSQVITFCADPQAVLSDARDAESRVIS